MNVLVVGGGMSGLTFAISALRLGYNVTIVEKNARVGKKIVATGNGKCNIGNQLVTPACFNDSKLANVVVNAISVETYKDFLHSVGIYTYTDTAGRMYPYSDSSSTVVDCLRFAVERLGGTIVQGEATNITQCGGKYAVTVDGKTKTWDKVVLSVGSGSQAPMPNVASLVDSKYLTPTCPSLVPIKVTTALPTLNGVRHKCTATLVENGHAVYLENGEVLFRDYGLSGICIFNMSAVIARSNVRGENNRYQITLDLLPDFTAQQLTQLLQKGQCLGSSSMWGTLLHNKLAHFVQKTAGQNASFAQLANTAKNLTFDFSKLLDWSMSQVTAGGVNEKYLNLQNLTLPNGVICIGEMLNVDGLCGGNNLYFAGASALYAVASMD